METLDKIAGICALVENVLLPEKNPLSPNDKSAAEGLLTGNHSRTWGTLSNFSRDLAIGHLVHAFNGKDVSFVPVMFKTLF